MSGEIKIEVSRSDLIYMKRVLDSMYPLIEELVHEGDEDPELMIQLDDLNGIVKEYLS